MAGLAPSHNRQAVSPPEAGSPLGSALMGGLLLRPVCVGLDLDHTFFTTTTTTTTMWGVSLLRAEEV